MCMYYIYICVVLQPFQLRACVVCRLSMMSASSSSRRHKARAIADKNISVEELRACLSTFIKESGSRDIDDYLLAAGDQTCWNPTAKPQAVKCHRLVELFVEVCSNCIIPSKKLDLALLAEHQQKPIFFNPKASAADMAASVGGDFPSSLLRLLPLSTPHPSPLHVCISLATLYILQYHLVYMHATWYTTLCV